MDTPASPSVPIVMLEDVHLDFRTNNIAMPTYSVTKKNPEGMFSPKLERNNGYRDLAHLIRACAITGSRETSFWSCKLLTQIMTRERVHEALSKECPGIEEGMIGTYLEKIVPDDYDKSEESGNSRGYLKIFAILLLQDLGSRIGSFIRHGVCDEDLPLVKCHETDQTDPQLARRGNAGEKLACFVEGRWKPYELDYFYETQWRINVPFLCLDNHGTPQHYDLPDKAILPYRKTSENEVDLNNLGGGGYGTVKRVQIDPGSHGFHGLLENASLTACHTSGHYLQCR